MPTHQIVEAGALSSVVACGSDSSPSPAESASSSSSSSSSSSGSSGASSSSSSGGADDAATANDLGTVSLVAGVFELLEMTDEIRMLIGERTDGHKIDEAAIRSGMTTMIVDGIAKCRAGLTSPSELLRVTTAR